MDEHDGPGTTLAGIKVLDLTRNLAGPFATMILGALGADVVKVEAPGRGDDTREWRPPSWNGESTQFLAANRNKRSIAVDLDDPAGAGIVRALARRSDIVIESFKPGSLDKRGLGYDALAAENPGLIFCTISAFGHVGPMAGRPGYDPVIQAYSGMMSITGEADRPPVRLPIGAIDLGTGLWCTIAIQSALLRRRESRRGCFIDTSLFEVAVWWLVPPRWLSGDGERPPAPRDEGGVPRPLRGVPDRRGRDHGLCGQRPPLRGALRGARHRRARRRGALRHQRGARRQP